MYLIPFYGFEFTARNSLYDDILAIAPNANITTTNITTITGDQANIATDLDAPRNGSTSTTTTTTTMTGFIGE